MGTDTPLAASTGAPEGTGFDHVLERLRTVVERLEQGNLSLEESLKIFEEGVALARKGHTLLEAAEKRVEVLVRGPGGVEADVAVPFERTPGAG
jgi:exodeoxyribonuclease VII small subunit